MLNILGSRQVKLRSTPTQTLSSLAIAHSAYSPRLSKNGQWAAVACFAPSTLTAYVNTYYKNNSGGWNTAQSFSSSVSDYGFGLDWSENGDRLVIGIPGHNSNAGLVKIYTNNNGTFLEEAELLYTDAGISYATSRFGYSVSFSADGSRLIVGARTDTYTVNGTNYINIGSASIFKRVGTTWSLESTLFKYTNAPFNTITPLGSYQLGYSVCLSGDGTRAVASNTSGSVTRILTAYWDTNTNTWVGDSQVLTAQDLDFRDPNLGTALSMSFNGNVLVVGASGWDCGTGGGNDDAGAVLVYNRSGNTWIGATTDNSYILNRTGNLAIGGSLFGKTVNVDDTGSIITTIGSGTNKLFVFKNRILETTLTLPYNPNTSCMSKNGKTILVTPPGNTNTKDADAYYRR